MTAPARVMPHVARCADDALHRAAADLKAAMLDFAAAAHRARAPIHSADILAVIHVTHEWADLAAKHKETMK